MDERQCILQDDDCQGLVIDSVLFDYIGGYIGQFYLCEYHVNDHIHKYQKSKYYDPNRSIVFLPSYPDERP